MVETFCDSGAVKYKVGLNASSTITDDPVAMTQFINQAESYINTVTRINYTDTYSSLNADTKKILEDAASSKAAIAAINYDMSGYTSLSEAQTMLDVNYTLFEDAIKLLKDKKATDFIDSS